MKHAVPPPSFPSTPAAGQWSVGDGEGMKKEWESVCVCVCVCVCVSGPMEAKEG